MKLKLLVTLLAFSNLTMASEPVEVTVLKVSPFKEVSSLYCNSLNSIPHNNECSTIFVETTFNNAYNAVDVITKDGKQFSLKMDAVYIVKENEKFLTNVEYR